MVENNLTPSDLLFKIKLLAKQPILVAFSGGIDSTVLLHLLVCLRNQGHITHQLSAIHVNHGLSVNANCWADQCVEFCKLLQVDLIIEHVIINATANIEAQARNKRYRVFEQNLPKNGYLLMGHHLDDQAETVLFRLFRGSGLDGLSGIPVERKLGSGKIFRPLLDCKKKNICRYAKKHKLQFVTDQSNKDQRFTRNYLRQFLIPILEHKWPGVSSRLSFLAEEIADIRDRMDNAVKTAGKTVIKKPPSILWCCASVIDLDALAKLDGHLARRVLRYWIFNQGALIPNRNQLKSIVSYLIDANCDAKPCIQLGKLQLRRFSGKIALLPQLLDHIEPFHWNYLEKKVIILSNASKIWVEFGQGKIDLPATNLLVLFRRNLPSGFKCSVSGKKGRKTVKRWLQEYRVPPWIRDRIPLIFYQNKLVAVPGLFIGEGFQINKNNNDGGIGFFWVPEYKH